MIKNKNNKNNIDGILLLDKPLHLSSNQALQKVKRLFNAKKAGHTGSLDPLATGMLPICFGLATKLSQRLLESDKSYYAIAKLGEKTKTGDAEGEVIERRPIMGITLEKIINITNQFKGEIEQIPPMYSALKHQGRPLYELARQGIEIERKPRKVTIYQIEAEKFEEGCCYFSITCSKGTYIRTLVEDIGEALGTGAHVIGLRRSYVASFAELPMITLPQLEEAYQQEGHAGLMSYLLPMPA